MIQQGMSSRLPVRDWEDAFPGGNGQIGILVMGNPADEKIIVNHERLFLPMHGRVRMPDMSKYLPKIRHLIQAGSCREAAAFFMQKSKEQGFTGVGPDYFHPAFDLKISMHPRDSVSDCLRSLDFASGEILTTWSDAGNKLKRQLFVSRPDNVIVMSISATEGALPRCEFWLAESGMGTVEELETQRKYLLDTKIEAQDDLLSYRCLYRNDGGYIGAVRVIPQGGSMTIEKGRIIINNAEKILVLTGVSPNSDMEQLQKTLSNLPADYENLLTKHKARHGELFNRVHLDLGGGDDRSLSNEDLLAKSRIEGMSPALAERMHDFGRYLLICSSGGLPPNAQGLWNGTWKISNLVDYVTNIELEMATWPALQGALPECLEGYFDFIESMLPDWRENAKKLYGCRGILASSRSSNNGQLHHFSEEYTHVFWTAGAGWMAQTFYDYWLFTNDREFLLKRALPLMKEAALFYEDFLIDGPDDCLQFIPSVSPENNPGNSNSQAARNATMDIAVARELLTNLVSICDELNVESEGAARWEKLLTRLPEYQINTDGSLKEWADPDLQDNYPHRHLSHLYPAMPGFEAENDVALTKACKIAIDKRMENGLLRRCGWSLGHAVNVAARLKDSELLHQLLSEIATNFVKPSLFTLLDHDLGMFQIDANLGFSSAVMESLVFSQHGTVELFPALPEQWEKGRIEGVRCRGGITVKSLEWDLNARRSCVTLLSNAPRKLILKIAGVTQETLDFKSNQTLKLSFNISRPEYFLNKKEI